MTDEVDEPESEDEVAQERDRNRARTVAEAGIAALVMALEAAKPDFAPIAAALGVAGTAALGRLVDQVNEKRRERATYTLGYGISMADVSIDDFERRCQEDPNLLQLCTIVVLAAQDAAFQGKLDGLARSLQSALEDGSRVDEEILFASVLAQLEAPHIRLLATIGRNPAYNENNPNKNPEDYKQWAYNSVQIATLDPGLEHVLPPLLGTLSANGLIIRVEAPGLMMGALPPEHVSYSITNFGKDFLAHIPQLASHAADVSESPE